MDYLYFVSLVAFNFVLLGFILVLVIIRSKNQHKELLCSIFITKTAGDKAKISANYPYLKQETYKLRRNTSKRYILKQTIRWELLILIMCTKCFNPKYNYYTNTWLFKESEIQQFQKFGFIIKKMPYLVQLPARIITAVHTKSFMRILWKDWERLLSLWDIIKKSKHRLKSCTTICWNREVHWSSGLD